MLKRLQTFGLATIITLFIWLSAEAQSLDTDSRNIQVQLVVPDQSNLVLTSSRSSINPVKLDLQGSTAALDRLLRELSGTVQVSLTTPGEFTLDLQDRLSRMPPFKGSGVNIRDVDPAFIEQVVVERRVMVKDVPVRPPTLAGMELRGQSVTPAIVDVALPESKVAAFEAARYVNVAPNARALSGLGPGTHTLNVPVQVPPDVGTEHAVITPSTVTLTLDVRDNTETWMVGGAGGSAPLPVHVQLPPDLIGEYRIRLAEGDGFVAVTFTGPSQGIELLRQDRSRATPFIALTSDDLAKGITSAPIQFRGLPAGVTATPDNASVTIEEITDLTPGL